MKKRKILYLFPLAALVLSGCTLQEGWDVVKDFSVNKIYEPVRDFFLNLFGKEVPKEEEEQKPSGEGEGEGGGEHEGETSKYGTQANPLTVSEAIALITSEDPTQEAMYVTGEIIANGAWSTEYEQIDFTISDGQANLKVFRAVAFPDGFKASEVTANSMKGMSLVASGIGMTYKETYEVASDAENGIMCTVLSFAGEPEEQGQVDNYGTAEHPLTVSEAIEVIKIQDPTQQPIYVTGEVSGNGDWYSAKSNIDIYLTDGENTIQMFRANKFPEGMDLSAVKKNDLVGKIVVGKGIGTYYVDGKKYELDQNCEVISMVDPVIEITGVELSASELSLEVGQQATLTAKVLPEDKASQEVTWTVTSNDTPTNVISCNNGTIVAEAVGTAVVTATSVADPSKTAECTVTVKEATKTLESIAIVGDIATEYNEDDAYSAEGLKVMAHYDKGDDVDVTADAKIVLSKQVAEPEDTLLTITATYANKEAVKEVQVTVNAVNQFIEGYEAALALAANAESKQYTFKGVIVAKRQDNEWFIQHEGYGIEYYGNNSDFAVGKQVKVKSTLCNYNGLPETKTIASGTVIGDGVIPAAAEITTVAELEATKLNILANVTGVAKEDWSGYAASSNKTLKLETADGDISVYFKKNLFSDQEATLQAVKAGDTVTFSKVVTSTYNGLQVLFCAGSTISVTAAPIKTITEIVSVTGPQEVALNGSVSVNDVAVVVKYDDGSQGNAKVLTVTVDTTTAGQKQADVTIEGWNETLHFNITVKDESVPTPAHAGTQADPYTVSDAKILFDGLKDGENTAECFVTGTIVAEPAPTLSGTRARFYLSDGVCTSNLYAYNVDPMTGTTAHLANIPYGSVVVAKGAIKNYGGTFELCYVKDVAGCALISVERPALSSVVISGAASQTEYAVDAEYNHNGLVATANFASGAAVDVSNIATWAINPVTASAGDTSISVTATYDNVTSAAFAVSVTVGGDSPVVIQPYSQSFGSNNNGYTNSNNTAYANVYNVTLDGIDWKIPGNQSLAYGLKMGGKLSAETKRSIVSQTAFANPITSVDITMGTKDSQITVTKCALEIYATKADAANGTNMVEEVVATYVDGGKISFAKPEASDWTGVFIAMSFSMTSSAASKNCGVVVTNFTVNF